MMQNDTNTKPTKRQSGFFTFLFNPSQFVKDAESDLIGDEKPDTEDVTQKPNTFLSQRSIEAVPSAVLELTVKEYTKNDEQPLVSKPACLSELQISQNDDCSQATDMVAKITAEIAVEPDTASEKNAQRSEDLASHLAKASSEQIELAGTVFADRYEIISSIGRGASSRVYRARQIQLDRLVALKIMHPHLLVDETNLKRFEQEAKATSTLSHTNLVLIHDYGICPQGRPFLVMDYAEGPNMEELISRVGHLQEDSIIDIFSQCCRALAHAHRKGIVHRDIKPGNVKVTENDRAEIVIKILDFGIAKSFTRDKAAQQLTEVGSVVGSPLFMSPEQCRAEPVDPRTDIYSLGVAMFLAATGNYPFVGKEAFETLFKQIYEPIPTFESLDLPFKVSQQLEAIIHKCMEKEPVERFSSMEDLESALMEIKLVQSQRSARQETDDKHNEIAISQAVAEQRQEISECGSLDQKNFDEEQLDFNPESFKVYLSKFSYYDLLQVDQESTTEGIHVNYLRRMRNLLRPNDDNQLADWQLAELVRQINIAHQILTSSKLRALYEAALNKGQLLEVAPYKLPKTGKLIEISELIRMFRLLGPETGQILDKLKASHEGLTERELAAVITEQGLISEEDMESLVLARYLLATGKISAAQLELVMDEMIETKSTLWVGLVAKGWVKMGDLL